MEQNDDSGFRIVGTATGELPDTQPVGGHEGARVSMTSTAPYIDPRKGRCTANEDTCNAFAVKGTTLCYGHSRKAKAVEE